MSSQPLKWSFNLRGSTPQVDVAGGTIREANASTFPALSDRAGGGLSPRVIQRPERNE